MEETTIVNEEDKVIGYKKRGTLLPTDIYRVSALWIENNQGEILLARRAFTKKKDPGLWGPAVAGTVEKGENYESNIIKETEEELGLANVSLKKWIKNRVSSPHNHFTQFFKLKTNMSVKDFKIQEDEVAEIKWFTKKELLELVEKDSHELIPSLKKFIRKFLK